MRRAKDSPGQSRATGMVLATGFLCALIAPTDAEAQRRLSCPDGTTRLEIDVKAIAIQYQASAFAGTLSSLSVLGVRLSTEPKTLQTAAAATQQWNEFLKGLVSGYNSCVITPAQYAEGLQRIYPRLQTNASELEEMRKALSAGRAIDEQRMKTILDSYVRDLTRFAEISGREIIIERITAVVEKSTDKVLERLDAMEKRLTQTPAATPAEVEQKLSGLKVKMLAKVDEAEQAYNAGYALYERYRFAEAVPHLQQALGIIELPEFALALGKALQEVPRPREAEAVYRQALQRATVEKDEKSEAIFSNQLGVVLLAAGDLPGARTYMERALAIDEKVHGPEHPTVAIAASNLGQILQAQGDLPGARRYTERALAIDEKAYGPEHPTVAIRASNLGTILKEQGDLPGARKYMERALAIGEKVYGPEHPTVAIRASNLGSILREQGDLPGARRYTERALAIAEKVYGPEHPTVAIRASNLGSILKEQGDLPEARRYTERALAIDEKVYGPAHPTVAIRASNLGTILQDQGDLPGARRYMERALAIDEKVYGPEHPTVAILANNLGQILQAQGDLPGARRYAERALAIGEKVYGPEHPTVAIDASNLGTILQEQGDLPGARKYMERALAMSEKVYGPAHPTVAIAASNLGQILQEQGDLPDARRYTERALAITEKLYGPDDPRTKRLAADLRAIELLGGR